MKIAVIGTGYVGLVTGTCLAETGNNVICVDVNAAKVQKMQAGEIPIYEPGLAEIIQGNMIAGRLHFSTSLSDAMAGALVCLIAVGTPPDHDGTADTRAVFDAALQRIH